MGGDEAAQQKEKWAGMRCQQPGWGEAAQQKEKRMGVRCQQDTGSPVCW